MEPLVELTQHLQEFVTPERLQRMDEVLRWRTKWVQVVLEDIFNPHNSSAVMRSCEIFGVQHLHTIENRNEFRRNTEIDMGSSKWLHLHRFNNPDGGNTEACLTELKQQGLKIVATSLREGSVSLDELDLSQPMALCFGTEENGLSEAAHDMADEFVQIPMYGFTRSFNISVSCALSLRSLCERLHRTEVNWPLSAQERLELKLLWLRKSIGRQDVIINSWLIERGLSLSTIAPLPKELPDESREGRRSS